MQKLIFSIIIFIKFTAQLSAQVKNNGCFSIDDIKDTIASLKEESLSQFDSFTDSEIAFIIESPTLRTIDGVRFPASQWAFCFQKDNKFHKKRSVYLSDKNEEITLCWIKCNAPLENEKWSKFLKEKYGVIHINDKEEAVPAKWVCDTLYYASFPSFLKGLWPVNTAYPAWIAKEGKISLSPDNDFESNKKINKNLNVKPSLRTLVLDIRPDLFNILDGNGRQLKEISEIEMTLLAYEVNRNHISHDIWPENLSFLIMVYMTEKGHLDCEVIKPTKLSTIQQHYIDDLRKAFQKVTNIKIPHRQTLYGKYLPGIILQVRKDTRCWTFSYNIE